MLWYEDTSADSYVDGFVEASLARCENAEDELDQLVAESVDRARYRWTPPPTPPRPIGARLTSLAAHAVRIIRDAAIRPNLITPQERVRLLRDAASHVSEICRTLVNAAGPLPASTANVLRAIVLHLRRENAVILNAMRGSTQDPDRLQRAARRIPELTRNALRYAGRVGNEGAGTPSVRPSAPAGWTGTLNAFGKEIGWPASGRIKTSAGAADLARLRRAGVTSLWADQQARIYREIARLNPANPTAALRAEWLETIAGRLRGTS